MLSMDNYNYDDEKLLSEAIKYFTSVSLGILNKFPDLIGIQI